MGTENKKRFKLELEVLAEGNPPIRILTLYFSNLKLLRQGQQRKNQQYIIIDQRKYMLNEKGEYEPFAVFGKSAIKLSDLKAAVKRLELEEKEKGDLYNPQLSRKIPKTWK